MRRSRPQQVEFELKAKLFRGLADPSRLVLLEALRGGPSTVSELVKRTGLTQPNASMHLDCLHCCGLVERERSGRFVRYRIRAPRVRQLLAAGDRALEEVKSQVSACERYDVAGRRRRVAR
ncbi:MAG: ArsR/SmtB family transcription factor [Planctomycetota bacterium]